MVDRSAKHLRELALTAALPTRAQRLVVLRTPEGRDTLLPVTWVDLTRRPDLVGLPARLAAAETEKQLCYSVTVDRYLASLGFACLKLRILRPKSERKCIRLVHDLTDAEERRWCWALVAYGGALLTMAGAIAPADALRECFAFGIPPLAVANLRSVLAAFTPRGEPAGRWQSSRLN